MKKRSKNVPRTAFTLLEMLAVITIIAFVAALVAPKFANGVETTKERTCFHHRAQINLSVELYYIMTGDWPADDLSTFADGTDYFPTGVPTCPVSSASYYLNPTTHRVVGHTGGGKGGSHNP